MKWKELPKEIEKVIEKGIGFSKHYREGKKKHETLQEEKREEIEAKLEEHKKGNGNLEGIGRPENVTTGKPANIKHGKL